MTNKKIVPGHVIKTQLGPNGKARPYPVPAFIEYDKTSPTLVANYTHDFTVPADLMGKKEVVPRKQVRV